MSVGIVKRVVALGGGTGLATFMPIRYVGLGVVDIMLVTDEPVPDAVGARYATGGAEPPEWSRGETEYRGVHIVSSPMAEFGAYVRHDPARPAAVVSASVGRHRDRRSARTV